MSDLFAGRPISLHEQLAEALRELHLRRSVYPRAVGRGTMSQLTADRQIRLQEAIVETLRHDLNTA